MPPPGRDAARRSPSGCRGMASARSVEMHDNSLILIVEDNPELGARLTRDVRRYGGAEAAELVQEYDEAIARLLNEPAPRAVVMEYRMRAHTGVDLALWMAAQPRLADT